MPNNVTNQINFHGKPEDIEIVMKIIRNIDEGRDAIDFNRLIPMPDELDIVYSSDLFQAIGVYLTLINPNNTIKAEGLEKLNTDTFGDIVNRLHEGAFISPNTMLKIEEIKQIVKGLTDSTSIGEVIGKGKMGINNLMKYGAVSWCEWCCKNWGTERNAYKQSVESDTSISFNTAWTIPEPILQNLAKLCYDHNVWFEGQFVSDDWQSRSGWFKSNGTELIIHYDETEEKAAERAQKIWGYDPREYCDDEEE